MTGLFNIDVEEEMIILADRFHLSNIIGNLIDNAIKYSGESVSIDITARRANEGTEIRIINVRGTGYKLIVE